MAFVAPLATRAALGGGRGVGREVRKPGFAPLRTAQSRRARVFPQASVADSSSKVRDLSADELDTTIKAAARPILLDAYAAWCGPCQFMAPELEKLAKRYGDAIDVLKLDTEAYPELASALVVRGLPTLFFIKDAQLVFRMEGALTAEELEKMVNFFFFKGPRPDSFRAPEDNSD